MNSNTEADDGLFEYMDHVIHSQFKDRFVPGLKRRAVKLVYLRRAISIFEGSSTLKLGDLRQEDSKPEEESKKSPLKQVQEEKSQMLDFQKMREEAKLSRVKTIKNQITKDCMKLEKLSSQMYQKLEVASSKTSHHPRKKEFVLSSSKKRTHSRDSSIKSEYFGASSHASRDPTVVGSKFKRKTSTSNSNNDMIRIEDGKKNNSSKASMLKNTLSREFHSPRVIFNSKTMNKETDITNNSFSNKILPYLEKQRVLPKSPMKIMSKFGHSRMNSESAKDQKTIQNFKDLKFSKAPFHFHYFGNNTSSRHLAKKL